MILPDDVVVGDRPCIGQLIHAYNQTHALGRRGDGGPAARRPAATASSPREPSRTRSTTAGSTGSRRLVEKPAPGRRAVEPGDHRPLRPDAEDLRQARADPARRRRRDPADRRDRGADGGAGGLRLRVRGHPLRRRHDDGLAQGLGRARARSGRTSAPSSAPTSERSTLSSEPSRQGRPAGGRRRTVRCPRRRRRTVGPGNDGGDVLAEIGQVLGGRYRLVELLGQGGMATIYRATDTAARPRRRRQAPPTRVPARPRLLVALPPGGPGGRLAEPPEHRHGLRLRRGPGRAVHRHGARRRRGPRHDPAPDAARCRRARPPGSRPRSPGPSPRPTPAGIVHRDIKPGNILIGRDGRVKVADFGIARAIAEAQMTLPGTTLGSVHYFSPEQARGEPATAASDIYCARASSCSRC